MIVIRLDRVLADRKMKLKSSTDYVMSRALDHQGETVLLMVNISPDTPADVTVTHNGNEMEDFFDSAWKYKGDHGKFQFKLKPVETKVLRFNRK